jgi:hypothetical protein
VIALSHFWRTKEHPDPDGETMELIVAALEQRWHEFEDKGVTDLGILVDWCALWQAPRETPEKKAAFKAGLKGINLWYAHQGTTVWLVTGGADRVNGKTYWDKGWTSFEFALAMLIKPANSSQIKDWPQVVDLGKEGNAQTAFARPALSEPLAFFSGHAYGDKTYTNGADRDAIVAPKFQETMFQVMGGVHTLNFGKLNWEDVEIEALAIVLPLCGQLRELKVHGNSFGDTGMIALVGAIGAIEPLKELWLGGNRRIGDAGVEALASACAGGAMAKLEKLLLDDNQIGDAGVSALVKACDTPGAMAQLKELFLFGNKITDKGCSELARACEGGAMANLEKLWLFQKLGPIGIDGVAALDIDRARKARPQLRVRLTDPRMKSKILWQKMAHDLTDPESQAKAQDQDQEQEPRAKTLDGAGPWEGAHAPGSRISHHTSVISDSSHEC